MQKYFTRQLYLMLSIISLFSSFTVFSQSPNLVQDVYAGPLDLPFNQNSLIEFNDQLYFLANDGIHGRELWRSDGDTAVLIQDIRLGIEGSNPEFFTVIGDQLVFRAFDDIHGAELWTFDGDTATLIQDLYPGSSSSGPRELFAMNGEVFFRADNGIIGQELWKYDGISISLVQNIRGGSGNADPGNFAAYQDNLYFSATDGIRGFELWKYDGDTVTMVRDINRSSGSSNPSQFVVFGNELIFTADDGINGVELWKYDGDTVMIAFDINSSEGSSPHDLVVLATELLFAANDGINGEELWRYDGSTASLVKDINIGAAGLALDSIVRVSEAIYFMASDGIQGRELWKYDGSEAVIVEDINPGAQDADPTSLVAFGTNLYFSAVHPTLGRELFKYDGQILEVFDINLDTSSNPRFMTGVGCDLFFGALGSTAQGTELWILRSAGDSEGFINEFVCNENYAAPDGQVYDISGEYTAIIPNSIGCDSLVTINLILNSSTSSTIVETACRTYEAPDGQVYDANGIYTAVIPNMVGCDSTITIDLTVIKLNTNINIDGITLSAEASGLSYQWLDCNNNFTPIPGATSQSFTPPSSGEYVVELTDGNGCVDTTACINGIVSALSNDNLMSKIRVYPTISTGVTHVSLNQVYHNISISITNMTGQLMSLNTYENVDKVDLSLPETKGYYLIEIQVGNTESEVFRVVKY